MEVDRRRAAVTRDYWAASPQLLAALAAAYIGLSLLIWQVANPAETGAPWWPAAGLTLGVMCRVRPTAWPAVAATIFAADFAADMVQGSPVGAALAWAAANTVEPVLGAVALRRAFAGRLPNFESYRNVAMFFGVAAVAGPPLASLLGASASALAFDLDLLETWGTWYVGDVLGILVVAPVVFYAAQIRAAARPRLIGLVLGIGAVTLLVLGAGDSISLFQPYLITPLMVFAVFVGGTPGAIAVGFLTAVVANAVSTLGYGPFALEVENPNALLELQLFTAVDLLTVYLLAGVQAQLLGATAHAALLSEERLRDPLTRIGNRRLLDRALVEVTTKPVDGVALTPAAALMIDLDGFKPINDEHGHAVGDEVLRIVARRIDDAVRGSDTVARLGGDEFAVVCPTISEDDVRGLVDRLKEQIGAPMVACGHHLTASASVGYAWIAEPTRDPADLLRRADLAMYSTRSARTKGRRSVEAAQPEQRGR